MRLVLKDFQCDAVQELTDKLRRAAREVMQSREPQAISLSSPTGSGKTAMVTAAMEAIVEGDAENLGLADAVFLWITDQPQLNEQTRRKMLATATLFSELNLVTIGSAFDQPAFTPGTVNFINIQKLGKERDLITKGDGRNSTIWETITNTVASIPERFFLVIDEAHRGMSEGSQARKEANSIIQKFIKGSSGEIPKVPLILGISATLDRFDRLVSGTGRTRRPVEVPIEQVRASGLLKDVVTLFHPTVRQPTDITMLREAVRSWIRIRDAWALHCKQQGEELVRPILVVQVQDASGRRTSKSDLDEVVSAIEDELGALPSRSLAHAFQEGAPVAMNGKDVRYLPPADIDADDDVRIVFFKTSLNTGWDCPRAEVMMSFRTALDATSIAQLVGRMVRSPLARRIESSEILNCVELYLPHYDQKGLAKVLDRLTSPDPDTLPPVDFQSGESQVTVTRVAGSEAVFRTMEHLPSYLIPSQRKSSQVRRLMKLARALSNDDLHHDAEEEALSSLVAVLRSEYNRVQQSRNFAALVEQRSEIVIRALDWQIGLESVTEESSITLQVSSENIDDIFEDAGRRIGDEGLHKVWWKARRVDGIANMSAKLELIVLSIDPTVRKRLETTAQQSVQAWLRTYTPAIRQLSERRRAIYDEISGLASEPELRNLVLPQDIVVTKADTSWARHVYADADGLYPASLNRWEAVVVNEELLRDKNCLWLRNIPRKPWALTVPYEVNGKATAFYPDFILFTKDSDDWIASILDPHHIDLADAPAKAVGLAKYAARHHGTFARIELIIVRGHDDIRRIDLTDEAKRERVLAAKNKEYLALLFDDQH